MKNPSPLRVALFGVSCVLPLLLGGCNKGGGESVRLEGGGSTFVYPMMSKWAKEYEKAKKIEVNYQSIGSGGGIQKMTSKDFDFGCTDGPLNQEQLDTAAKKGGDVVHIPLVMGAVVPIYNLPDLDSDKPLIFSGEVLAKIFLGEIKEWNHQAIQDINPGVNLPRTKIVVVHRSDGSGTTYIWVDYLAKVSKIWSKKVGVGTSVSWPAGVGQKGNEGVSRQTGKTAGAIGYVELIYALQNKIHYGKVINREKKAILPSLDSVRAAAKNALTDIPEDLRYSLTNAPGDSSYPVSGTVWAVIYVKQPAKGKHVVDFLRWVTHDGQKFAEPLHYAALPDDLIKRIDAKLDAIKFDK
jgi:phosphate transport system substrate-binding protein